VIDCVGSLIGHHEHRILLLSLVLNRLRPDFDFDFLILVEVIGSFYYMYHFGKSPPGYP
jgi:hypothetical protein